MKDGQYSTYRDGEWVSVPPIDKLCLALKEKFMRQEERIEYLEKENKELKDSAYAEKEMAKMKDQLNTLLADYHRGFSISKEEQAKIHSWMEQHEKEHPGGHGVSGGKYTYEFCPTGLGTIGYVKCSCGKKFCFQDL